ncbi:hypothetical protein DICPUDRAFT_6436, partial [Dictyostelium purpureum]
NNKKLNIVLNNEKNNNYYIFINPLFKKTPVCYVKIESVDNLKEALKYAKSLNKRVSIRSGGHSCCVFSILNGTVNLDMSGLSKIQVNVEEKTVTAQSGATMLEYYKETTKYGLASPGGSCPSVCLGGLALGGGSNMLSITHGYMLDNIIEITILLENGEVVRANKDNQYCDLFWALRGSGHTNYGIVIDYKVKLHAIEPFFYHNTIDLPFDLIIENNTIINDYSKSMDKRVYLGIENRITAKTKKLTSIVIFFFNGPVVDGEKEFRKLVSLLKQPKVIEIDGEKVKKTFVQIIERVPYANKPRRSYTKSRFMSEINKESSVAIKNIMEKVPQLLNEMVINDNIVNFSANVYYHGGVQNSISKDECAFIHRGYGSLWSINFICYYLKEENDKLFSTWKNFLFQYLDKSFGTQIYQNYPDDEVSNWQERYYGQHYSKLQQIKLKYDPNNYFKYQQSIEL